MDPFFVKAASDAPSDPNTIGFLQRLWGISSLNSGWNHGGNSVEIGNSLYFSCHFQFACERGSEKAEAEFNLGKKKKRVLDGLRCSLCCCGSKMTVLCISYFFALLTYCVSWCIFCIKTFHSVALIEKTSLRSHMDKSSWVSPHTGKETNRHFQNFQISPRQRDKFPEFPVKRSLMFQKYSVAGGDLKAPTGIRQWAGAEEVGAERLLLDERGWMIIEHTAGPEMINAILLFHLLFINSLSAIMAWAQMKGEGRGEVQVGHH